MIFRALFLYTILRALCDFLSRRELAYRYVVEWTFEGSGLRVVDRVAIHADRVGK